MSYREGRPMPQETPERPLGLRIDLATTVDEVVALSSEAARNPDTPQSHRDLDDCLARLVRILAERHPLRKRVIEVLRRFEKADRWYG